MQELMYYDPIDLPPAESEKLYALFAQSFPVLSAAARELYDFPNVKKLRNDYKGGKITLRYNPRAKQVLDRLVAVERRTISAHIRLGVSLCNSYDHYSHQRPGVTCEDYLQCCAEAIYDAMYTYNGERQFSTYAVECMRHRMIDFVRAEERAAGVGKKIKKLRVAINNLMKQFGYSFEEAIERVRSEEAIDEKTVEKVRDSLYSVKRIDAEDTLALSVLDCYDDDNALMRRAVAEAKLSDLQKQLVEGYLSNDRRCRRRIIETQMNPNTGEPWTSQRLSQIFIAACAVIRAKYEELTKRIAA